MNALREVVEVTAGAPVGQQRAYGVVLHKSARILLATRVIYRALKISPNTARKAARALEADGMLRAHYRATV